MEAAEELFLDQHEIRLLSEDGDTYRAFITIQSHLEDIHMLITSDERSWSANEADAFEALCTIRKEMRTEGLMPECNGAAINVYPSSMARDMGQGLSAYKMTMGRHASNKDRVRIWEYEKGLEIVYPKQQEEWFQTWHESTKVIENTN